MLTQSFLPWSLVIIALSVYVSSASKIVSQSSTRLPMGIKGVISDLEAEGVKEISSACIITSRGVTKSQRSSILKDLFNLENEDSTTACVGKKRDDGSGIVLANVEKVEAAPSTAVSCGGTIVYIPNMFDLSRGEGLFDVLSPAMERLSNQNSNNDGDASIASSKAVLVVVVGANQDINVVKSQLEQAAVNFLPSLVQPFGRRATVLEDIFDKVEYVPVSDAASFEDKLCTLAGSCDTSDASSNVAASDSAPSGGAITLTTERDIAAARKLGPAARDIISTTLSTISDATSDDNGDIQLTTNFGQLCDAAVKQAVNQFNEMKDGITKDSPITKQIQTGLKNELSSELGDMYNKQLDILKLAMFDQFKQSLSQLKLSPNLPNDMARVCDETAAAFTSAARKLQPNTEVILFGMTSASSSYSFSPAKIEFVKTMKDFCNDRLIVATASGKFKPLPRKGVTVGLHWLLPKPFGNDYRQEPWMDHAKDNLVYVPKDKLTEVSKEDIQKGTDWRSKIVPSPVGNQLVFMQ